MKRIHVMTVAFLGGVLCAQSVGAQAPFRYRDYALGSSLASVVEVSNARADDIKTLHERPARIQEVEWRAPYLRSEAELADPVRGILFRFYDDQLYQVVVTYDRDRVKGLTDDDLIATISATYGVPLLRHTRIVPQAEPYAVRTDTRVVAQWEDTASRLTLTRDTYSALPRLVLFSKELNAGAHAAIKEAARLDTEEAPQRERDRRTQAAADAHVEGERARVVNRPAFTP